MADLTGHPLGVERWHQVPLPFPHLTPLFAALAGRPHASRMRLRGALLHAAFPGLSRPQGQLEGLSFCKWWYLGLCVGPGASSPQAG